MRAVWRAARAAVRRRKLQTVVIGLVGMFSAATITIALVLLIASVGPFDRAFTEQNGAHVVAAFDAAKATGTDLAATAELSGVAQAEGPFGQAVLDFPDEGPQLPGFMGGPVTAVGRPEPSAGSVDQVDVWEGRWATAPGEIVLNAMPPAEPLPFEVLGTGDTVTANGVTFTVVGLAYSLSRTADAWVSPEQMALLEPATTQMLYRLTEHDTKARIDAGIAAITAALPQDSVLAAQSYLTVKETVASGPGVIMPFLMVFGILGLVVAILIVVNVVSGAVVSGYRHIGILKALGFTPRQVSSVYLVMVSVPAVIGTVVGTVAGDLTAQPLLSQSFEGAGLGEVTVDRWVDVVVLLGLPAIVLLAAFLPARRAHRLPAAEAISAGSRQHSGRGLRVQRWLSGTRLPRSVSMGLGLPFARPARSLLTMAAVGLGVMTVAFATGFLTTIAGYMDAQARTDEIALEVLPRIEVVEGKVILPDDFDTPREQLEAVPGTSNVVAIGMTQVSLAGYAQGAEAEFLDGDSSAIGFEDQLTEGRWFEGPGEVVVSSTFAHQRDVAVGDHLTISLAGGTADVTVVGQVMGSRNAMLHADWSTLDSLVPDPGALELMMIRFEVQIDPGTDLDTYMADVRAAVPGWEPVIDDESSEYTVIMTSLATTLTVMLGTVAALGVFNTVVLMTRERRRDLGMLKSIGMTPRQVVLMVLTSMAVLGAVGGAVGIGLGMVAHRVAVPMTTDAAQLDLPESLMRVWDAPLLAVLALAGVAIAVVGAWIPARRASRLRIAEVLRSE